MSSGGVETTPEALAQAAKGINQVVGELSGMGIAGTGDVGRGFSELDLTGMQLGNAGLKGALDNFCSRWSWGVRTLVQDANVIAQQLGLAAGAYHDVDQQVMGGLKQLGGSVVADPHLTGDQIQKESWSQMAQQAATPDYSGKSFQNAEGDMAKTWTNEAKDLEKNTTAGRLLNGGE